MTTLTIYGSAAAATTVSTAGKLFTATGGTTGATATRVGKTTTWVEIFGKGTTNAQTGVASIGSPTGNGWLYDVTTLEGGGILAGTWTPTVKLLGTATGVTVSCTIRFYKRSSGGVYTSIGTAAGNSLALTASAQSVTFASPPSLSRTAFATGDKLYVDVWCNITANTANSTTYNISIQEATSGSSAGHTDNQTTTPGSFVENVRTISSATVSLSKNLTVYGSTNATATLATAGKLFTTASASAATLNKNLAIVANQTGYGELTFNGNSPTLVGSLPSPSGKGFLYDSTFLENARLQGGTWTSVLQLQQNTGTTITADVIVRYYKYNGGVYTSIGSNTLTGQTFNINTTYLVYAVTGTLSGASFGSGDKLYIDVWLNVTANSNGVGVAIRMLESNDASNGWTGSQHETPGLGRSVAASVALDYFVERSSSEFKYKGVIFRFAGYNFVNLARAGYTSTQMGTLLAEAKAAGATVVRIWAVGETTSASPSEGIFQYGTTGGTFNETQLVELDTAIAQAASLGLKVVLVPGDRNATYGGAPTYVQWYDTANATSYHTVGNGYDKFFESGFHTQYKTWLSTLANRTNTVTGLRYGGDPTIMSWECMNESRYSGAGTSDTNPNTTSSSYLTTLNAFFTDVSAHIKGLAPSALVGTGGVWAYKDVVGGDPVHVGTGIGNDYVSAHSISTIDYCDIHLYPTAFTSPWANTWSSDAAYTTQLSQWATDGRGTVGKPVVYGEYAIQRHSSTVSPTVLYPRETAYNNFFATAFLNSTAAQNINGVLLWSYKDDRDLGLRLAPIKGGTVPSGNLSDETLLSYVATLAPKLAGTHTVPATAAVDRTRREVGATASLGQDFAHGGTLTSLTVYPTSGLALDMVTALLATASSGSATTTNTTSKIGTATGYGEIRLIGNSVDAWSAAGSLGTPGGFGTLLDVTTLEGMGIPTGSWQAKLRLAVSEGTVGGDLYVRVYVYDTSAHTFTSVGQMVASGISITSTGTTFTTASTTLPFAVLSTGQRLYVDYWLNITSSTSTLSTTTLAVQSIPTDGLGNATTNYVTTPGYATQSTLALSRTVGATASLDINRRIVGATVPLATALTVYGTITAASTVATAALFVGGTGGSLTNRNITVPVGTGYLQFQPTTSVSSSFSGSIGSMDGKGYLLDVTTYEGQQFAPGPYSMTFQIQQNAGTALVGDLYCRVGVRRTNGAYESWGTLTLAGQTFPVSPTAFASYTLTGTLTAGPALGSGDKLYADLWVNITTNSNGVSEALRLNSSNSATLGNTGNALVTGGYFPAVYTTQARTVSSTTASLTPQTQRPVSATAALSLTRTVSALAPIMASPTRTTPATIVINAFDITRTVTPVTTAIKSLDLARTVSSATTAIKQLDLARTVTVTTPLLSTLANTISSATAAIQQVNLLRTVSSASAAIKSLDLARTVAPATTAIKQLDIARTVTATVAVKQLDLVRTVTPVTGALLATLTRTVTPATGALLATPTRTVTVTVAVKQLDIARTVTPATTAVQQLNLARTVSPVTGALLSTLIRTVGVTGAVGSGGVRTITGVLAPIMASPTRAVPALASILATPTRVLPTTSALQSTPTRTVVVTAPLLSTLVRTVGATLALKSLNLSNTVTPVVAPLIATPTRAVIAAAAIRSFDVVRTVTPVVIPLTVLDQVRTISGIVAPLGSTFTQSVPPTAAIKAVSLVRTVGAAMALGSGAQRVVLTTAVIWAPDQVRTAPATVVVKQLDLARTVGTVRTALLSQLLRTVGSVVVPTLSTPTRATIATAVLLSTPTRVVAASAALQRVDISRMVPDALVLWTPNLLRTVVSVVAPILSTPVRSVPSSAAVVVTLANTVPATLPVQRTNTRTVGATVPAKQLDLVRTVSSATAALLQPGLLRTITGNTVAVKQLDLARTVTPVTLAAKQLDLLRTIPSVTGAIGQTANQRATPATVAVKQLDLARTVTPVTVAVKQLDIVRTVSGTTAALFQPGITRTLTPVRAALLQPDQTRTILTVAAAILQTQVRTISVVRAAVLATSVRTVGGVTLATQATLLRTVPATVPIQTTRVRTVGVLVALQISPSAAVPATVAIKQVDTQRLTPATVALLQGTQLASVPASAALLQSRVRTLIPVQAAIMGSPTRAITTTACIYPQVGRSLLASVALDYPRHGTATVAARQRHTATVTIRVL
jgi:hypothetical protein